MDEPERIKKQQPQRLHPKRADAEFVLRSGPRVDEPRMTVLVMGGLPADTLPQDYCNPSADITIVRGGPEKYNAFQAYFDRNENQWYEPLQPFDTVTNAAAESSLQAVQVGTTGTQIKPVNDINAHIKAINPDVIICTNTHIGRHQDFAADSKDPMVAALFASATGEKKPHIIFHEPPTASMHIEAPAQADTGAEAQSAIPIRAGIDLRRIRTLRGKGGTLPAAPADTEAPPVQTGDGRFDANLAALQATGATVEAIIESEPRVRKLQARLEGLARSRARSADTGIGAA